MGWLRRFTPQSIGSKLTLAFGALICITLLVVAQGFVAGHRATQDINLTEGVRAPASLASEQAQASLLRMQLHVRGYLVLSDPQDLEQYRAAKTAFERSLAELQAMSAEWAEEDARSVAELTRSYKRWAELPSQLFELHDNPLQNRPALRLARVDVQARRVHILSALDEMIGIQKARESTPANRELLADMLRFQASFDTMATNLMAYGASGELNFKLAYGPQLATNAAIWTELVDKRSRLNADQRGLFDNIARLRAEVSSLALEIVATLSSEHAYEDLYLYRTRVTPQAESMLALLAKVTARQQLELQSGLAHARLSLADGRLQTAGGGLLAVLIGVAMVIGFRRSIVEPTQRLTAVARRIAGGDLSARATVESEDEIGVLARSITTMTERLVATIAHLESVYADAQRARDASESANRAKSAFLANMSHELRTPLNAVLGYAQILQRGSDLGQREAAALDTIRRSGEHLLTLINGVLDLARIEAGKVELYPETVRPAVLLHTVNDIIRLQAEVKGITYQCDIAPGLPLAVHADGKRLDQVLLNLLSNAVKFTEPGGRVSLSVRCQAGRHDQLGVPAATLRFTVEDTGIGIAEEQLAGIFRPFEQGTEVQRRFGGAGLGLAISQQLVGLMGSEIRVESRRGSGSRFWFDLEVPLAEEEEPLEATTRLGRRVTGYQGAQRKLLVVDDVAGNRAALVDYLAPLGFQMHEAASGEEALALTPMLRPDLLLIDNVMPGLSGLETIRRLRKLPATASLPIVMISASASAADVQGSLNAGADSFLPKPVDFDLLLSEVGRLLALQWLPGPDEPAAPVPDEPLPLPLPAVELEALYQLAQMGNMSGIRAQAEHLEEMSEAYRPFARRLIVLAERFQSAAVLRLVRRLRDEAHAELEQVEEE